ncbi:hypothetical protein KRMM14A1259_44790 [Krasilnikovia sp. MM14-A1259]
MRNTWDGLASWSFAAKDEDARRHYRSRAPAGRAHRLPGSGTSGAGAGDAAVATETYRALTQDLRARAE